MNVRIKDVYSIQERGEDKHSTWSRIGVAFVNKDESLNVILDAVPVNGKIHIRDRKKKNDAEKETQYEN